MFPLDSIDMNFPPSFLPSMSDVCTNSAQPKRLSKHVFQKSNLFQRIFVGVEILVSKL